MKISTLCSAVGEAMSWELGGGLLLLAMLFLPLRGGSTLCGAHTVSSSAPGTETRVHFTVLVVF